MLNTAWELRGIYELDGDTLTVCEGLERLKDFEKEKFTPRTFHRRTPATSPGDRERPRLPLPLSDDPKEGVPSSASTSGGISYIVRQDAQGAMVVNLAYMAKLDGGEPNVEYRPVAGRQEDPDNASEPDHEGGSSTSTTFPGIVLAHYEFRLDPAALQSGAASVLPRWYRPT